jgi:hypothetical protein
MLRKNGDVLVEPLRDGSYRWSVVLEPGDVVSDPMGLYQVRAVPAVSVPPHGKNAMPPMAKTPCPHGKNAMPPMAKTPWGRAPVDNAASPCAEPLEEGSRESLKEPLKIDLKDTCSKIHQQKADASSVVSQEDDDDAVDHKKLFQDLLAIGTGQRVARKLLREHEHAQIAQALRHVSQRKDVSNPAGYVVRELSDGGYKEIGLRNISAAVSREATPAAPSSHLAAQRARSEMQQLEQERNEKEAAYREGLKRLLARFADLPEDVKLDLKGRWTTHLEQLVPNTSRKAELLKEPRFERLAFREVTMRFFDLVDEGLSTEHALARLAA